jgi:ribonuclease P protein component
MQTFKKEERLTSKKLIDKLFTEGHTFNANPLRIIWLEAETGTNYPVSLVVSVSGKKVKKAVARNLIKRRIREAFRKNKSTFYEFLRNKQKNCIIAVIYLPLEIVGYNEIESKIIYMFKRLQKEYENFDR